MGVLPGEQQGRPARSLGRQGAEPQTGLHDVAVHAHPLRVRVAGQEGVGDARCDLHPEGRHVGAQREHRVERWGVGGGVEHPPAAPGPAGRVGEDRVNALGAQVEGHGVAVADRGGGEEAQVDRGECRRRLVGLHRQNRDAERRERHGVPAQAAAEVGDQRGSGVGVAAGVVGRHAQPGRLLETGGGEEHAGGEVAELPDRPGAQAGLRQGRRHEVRVRALLAQAGGDPQRGLLRVGRKLGEQRPALRCEELGEGSFVHRSILPVPAARRRLALTLTEC
ncbi:hypothetical protein [Georgenia sp. SUBG003]|uniref:hypothetical protein n=1 Tax=Georgenia sp. SUBG003 TaxID=1497974 RepID=UPI0004DA73AA|nr:hypothetical protein DA06_08660 [Georgenia sp. SUBG003]